MATAESSLIAAPLNVLTDTAYGAAEGRVADRIISGRTDTDYSSVFNAEYYAAANPDLAAAFGGDSASLLNHFINYGINEGRVASAEFNVNIYKNNYSDLRAAFGDDNAGYHMHYINYGKVEGRTAHTHSYTSKLTKAAGCTTDGVMTYTCSSCGATKGVTETNYMIQVKILLVML